MQGCPFGYAGEPRRNACAARWWWSATSRGCRGRCWTGLTSTSTCLRWRTTNSPATARALSEAGHCSGPFFQTTLCDTLRLIKMKKDLTNYAFIDSQNINLGIQELGWKLDWKEFRRHLTEKYAVATAYLYYWSNSTVPKPLPYAPRGRLCVDLQTRSHSPRRWQAEGKC